MLIGHAKFSANNCLEMEALILTFVYMYVFELKWNWNSIQVFEITNSLFIVVIEVLLSGQRTKVLHSDIGGTNGVIHIVNRVLHVPQDLTRDLNVSSHLTYSVLIFVMIILALLS